MSRRTKAAAAPAKPTSRLQHAIKVGFDNSRELRITPFVPPPTFESPFNSIYWFAGGQAVFQRSDNLPLNPEYVIEVIDNHLREKIDSNSATNKILYVTHPLSWKEAEMLAYLARAKGFFEFKQIIMTNQSELMPMDLGYVLKAIVDNAPLLEKIDVTGHTIYDGNETPSSATPDTVIWVLIYALEKLTSLKHIKGKGPYFPKGELEIQIGREGGVVLKVEGSPSVDAVRPQWPKLLDRCQNIVKNRRDGRRLPEQGFITIVLEGDASFTNVDYVPLDWGSELDWNNRSTLAGSPFPWYLEREFDAYTRARRRNVYWRCCPGGPRAYAQRVGGNPIPINEAGGGN